MDTIERLRATAATFGSDSLLVTPDGQIITLAKGYIPLLTNFTFEDKAAKGLRKGTAEDKVETPVYFSALELVRDHKVLLLSGPSGSGKTSFARHLSFCLATTGSIKPHPLVRNEDGTIYDEHWEGMDILPCYFTIDGPESFKTLVDDTLPRLTKSFQTKGQVTEPTLLIILDAIDKIGGDSSILLSSILAFAKGFENIKLILLGDTGVVKYWVLPSDVVRYDLFPLLEVQRLQAMSTITQVVPSEVVAGIGAAAATPAYFALALEAGHRGDKAEELLDTWLNVVAPERGAADRVTARAFHRLADTSLNDAESKLPRSTQLVNPTLFSNAVQQLLAARHLLNLPLQTAIALFHSNPSRFESILRSLLARLNTAGKSVELAEGLMRGSGANSQLGALLVSDFITESSNLQKQISGHMLAIIEEGTLPAVQKEEAGRVLSRLGDPRDLLSLANVPAGDFILGSDSHPNSQPPAIISLESFSIGLYPVINREFSTFVRETGRQWQSPDGFAPERQNAPATDLTWYDAMAYCTWLTYRWQLSGKLSLSEHVRLPTEPEWEFACRGNQNPRESGELIYPWGTKWLDDAANYEESGFNTRCSVGLFPKGRSPYGCYDMAGQVWEWCTTLWGEDMTTPSFHYPWRDDGREALDAPGTVRRVLRGGCFSSSRLKICCTYRGSLEPGSFWRGNGFRIVVAPVPSKIL